MQYWQQFSQDYKNKKVLIFGLGLQGGGVEVANTFALAGAQVRVSDQKSASDLQSSLDALQPGIEVAVGGHQETDIDWADCIIKNPAVAYNHPHIARALSQHKPVLGEMALALTYVRDHSIAITGTRGKTTTTSLIAHLLSAAGIPVILAGNIPGKPLLAQLRDAQDDTWFVIEIPSFQIESFPYTKQSAHIAVITTLYPDHLNRYATWDSYVQSKTDLFTYQKAGDIAVYQADKPWSDIVAAAIQPQVESLPVGSANVENTKNHFRTSLQGQHNLENIAVAVAVAKIFAIEQSILTLAVEHFSGVAFRQENLGTVNGITFINDTTSTTPVALEIALDTFKNKHFILITGGATKNLPLSKELLQKLAQTPQATFVLAGSGAKELNTAMEKENIRWEHQLCQSLPEAFQAAVSAAEQRQADTVLFSPGFASFEMFNNEFERGEAFNALIKAYQES